MADTYKETIVITFDEMVDLFDQNPPPTSACATVRFVNGAHELGNPTVVELANACPIEPSGLSIANRPGNARLTWTKLTENDLKRVRVYRGKVEDGSDHTWVGSAEPYIDNFIDDSLTGASAWWALRAEDVYEQTSTSSTAVSAIAGFGVAGWAHNLPFSPCDNNTVCWSAGSVYMPDGSTVHEIAAGDTGDMAAVTYAYLDIAQSTTALQTSTGASEVMGFSKLCLAEAENVAAGSAKYRVFGVAGEHSFIVADAIKVGTLSAISASMGSLTAGSITGVSASFGSGQEVILNDSGVSVSVGTSYEQLRSYQFLDSSDNYIAALEANQVTVALPGNHVRVVAKSLADYDSSARVYANAPSTQTAAAYLIAESGGVHVSLAAWTDGSGAGYITAGDDYISAPAGIHVGGTTDPGTDNLIVDGSALVSGSMQVSGCMTAGSLITTAEGDTWTLGSYTGGAPTADGYLTVTVNGTTYQILVNQV